jgi:hypothetical protein
MLPLLMGIGQQADTYSLLWRPAKGDTLSYVYYLSEGEGEKLTTVESPVALTVTAIDEDGYTVRSVAKDILITMGGEQMRDKREVVTVAQYGPFGNLVKILEGTSNIERARITKFIAPPMPMKPGESWSHTFPKEGMPPLQPTLTYKFKEIKEEEGRKLAVVEFSFNRGADEKPYGTGVWAIDTATGVPERMEAKTEANGGTVFKIKRVRG